MADISVPETIYGMWFGSSKNQRLVSRSGDAVKQLWAASSSTCRESLTRKTAPVAATVEAHDNEVQISPVEGVIKNHL